MSERSNFVIAIDACNGGPTRLRDLEGNHASGSEIGDDIFVTRDPGIDQRGGRVLLINNCCSGVDLGTREYRS